MTVSINGTSGIVNDATDLNYTGTLTGGTGVVNLGSGQLVKDASGNLGLGVTPSAWGTGASTKAVQIGNGALFTQFSGGNYTQLSSNGFQDSTLSWKYIGTDFASNYQQFNGQHRWYNAPSGTAGNAITFTQAMTLDSSGNLLVGTTSTGAYMDGGFNAQAKSASPAICAKLDTASPNPAQFIYSAWAPFGSGNNTFMSFVTETSPVIRGTISYNRAGGLTAYNTTSDYRAKTVNGPVQNALAKVSLLIPLTGRMNDATEDIDFFVAHQLQEVVPSAVTGEKDAVNEDSTPKYQMVDKSALIPLLTAAIQEQQTIIVSLKDTLTAMTARITALEGTAA